MAFLRKNEHTNKFEAREIRDEILAVGFGDTEVEALADLEKSFDEAKAFLANPHQNIAVKPPAPPDQGITPGQNVMMFSQARVNEAQLHLMGLAEIRMALNFPMVSDGDSGLGERTKLEPMFDSMDRPRLTKRYFSLLDQYLGYMKMFAKASKQEPYKFED